MSFQKAVIDIEFNKHTPRTENFQFHNIPCPFCGGKKGNYNQIGRDEWEWKDCVRCKGAGKYSAKIHVEWTEDFE